MHPARVLSLAVAGVVVARDACRKRETPLAPSQLGGLAGPVGADGAAGPRGEKGAKGDPGDFRVVDSTGRFVGIVDVGHPDSIAIRVPDVGLGILYSDQDGEGFWQGNATLYHESAECEGAALAGVSRYQLIQYVNVAANPAYFPLLPGSTRTIRSREIRGDTCATFLTGRGLCCEDLSSPEERFVAPTVAVPLASLGTPPFRVAE